MNPTGSKKLVAIALLTASLSAVSAGTATLNGAQPGSFEAIASQGLKEGGAPVSALASYATSFEAMSTPVAAWTSGAEVKNGQAQALSEPQK